MHEFSLLNNLLAKLEQISQDHGGKPILGVKVRLGALSHISPEHFAEHFRHSSQGTAAANAQLDVVKMEDESAPDAQEIVLESVDIEAD